MSHQGNLAETSFLAASNAEFITELYAQYLENPSSVDDSWVAFFQDLKDEAPAIFQELTGASWAPKSTKVIGVRDLLPSGTTAAPANLNQEQIKQATLDSVRALMLIRVYRVRGHLMANLDPLGLNQNNYHPELDPASYGFGPEDMDREIFLDNVLGLEYANMHQILEVCRATYCGNVGVEFMHIQDPDQKSWIQRRIEEEKNQTDFTVEGKKAILERMVAAESFEKFLHVKYPGTTWFSAEGGEALMPALEQIIKRGSQLGVEEIVLGMAHRARLNVLANVMNKPLTAIFHEFLGDSNLPDSLKASGDTKYHMGASSDREFDGKKVHLSLTANPSHLEAVNPVVLGKVRAKQAQHKDEGRSKVLGVLLHGDAAFAGQGVVAETLMLSQLPGYKTGGTIHIIVNNQIGFTTSPNFGRSSPYSSDVAKMIQAPILHVNGDDPEAVVHVARIATEFRQQFKSDVVIDMYCYRRHGHNEGDEPSFTQPIMYQKIKGKVTPPKIYADQLVAEGVVSADHFDAVNDQFKNAYDAAFEAAKNYKANQADWLQARWQGMVVAGETEMDRMADTGVSEELLRQVADGLLHLPEGFAPHRGIERFLEARRQMFDSGEGIDWATAESLAFGTLLLEGHDVRLSGQDCGRGTFSQRHAMVYDQKTGARYVALSELAKGKANIEIIDSPLAEFSVLGFDYGYTLSEPQALTMWEGQFGDFCNGAQVIIDQFLASAESKWLRMSGLVMLLPHGYEGRGPEHSSARLERFLQLCAEQNLQVMNMTTPANYFHALRAQLKRNYRKPLIIMTPKSLLRHKGCTSSWSDFIGKSKLQRVIGDQGDLVADGDIKRVVICSGKVYYDLLATREEKGIKDVAVIRLEKIYPLPEVSLAMELERYRNAEVVWCQEEPENMGAWHHLDRRLEKLLGQLNVKAKRPIYVGRPESASPATGFKKVHEKEQAQLVEDALMISTTNSKGKK